MDASKLGAKIKIDGKNQRTVLSPEEISKVINTFNVGKSENDFCVAVSYEDIEAKKMSFSAGQYFETSIQYIKITQEEYNCKIKHYLDELNILFKKGHLLEKEIQIQMEQVKYENE